MPLSNRSRWLWQNDSRLHHVEIVNVATGRHPHQGLGEERPPASGCRPRGRPCRRAATRIRVGLAHSQARRACRARGRYRREYGQFGRSVACATRSSPPSWSFRLSLYTLLPNGQVSVYVYRHYNGYMNAMRKFGWRRIPNGSCIVRGRIELPGRSIYFPS